MGVPRAPSGCQWNTPLGGHGKEPDSQAVKNTSWLRLVQCRIRQRWGLCTWSYDGCEELGVAYVALLAFVFQLSRAESTLRECVILHPSLAKRASGEKQCPSVAIICSLPVQSLQSHIPYCLRDELPWCNILTDRCAGVEGKVAVATQVLRCC